jgi:branched-chain amino acid transport system ATP-binding protein
MLEISNLVVRYGRITALRGVSLTIEKGSIVGIVGPNGAGKSTLLSTIAGIKSPAEGTIRLNGQSIAGKQPESIVRLGISLVPEQRRIFGTLTVRENLVLGATSLPKAEAEHEIEAALDLFPILRERSKSVAGTLSGGEQQQLAIARGFVSKPTLMLLDEPSLGLAPKMTDLVYDSLRLLHERGMTVVLVEQDLARATAMADHSYVFRTGEIVHSGARGEIAEDTDLIAIYLGGPA